MAPRRRQAGLTLLEIMVVLAIIGLLALALVYGYRRLPATVLRRDATRLTAVLRSAYDRAAASGAHHRVTLDLDQRSYFVERCEGKVELRPAADQRDEEERRQREEEQKRQLQQAQSGPGQVFNEIVAQAGTKVGETAECGPVTGEMGTVEELTRNPEVRISRVYVRHLQRPVDSGKVQVHFFPMGRAERSVVELQVGDETLSIVVHPLSGRVQIVNGVWPHPEDFVAEDAEGKRQ
jgi:type II secretion system protein H